MAEEWATSLALGARVMTEVGSDLVRVVGNRGAGIIAVMLLDEHKREMESVQIFKCRTTNDAGRIVTYMAISETGIDELIERWKKIAAATQRRIDANFKAMREKLNAHLSDDERLLLQIGLMRGAHLRELQGYTYEQWREIPRFEYGQARRVLALAEEAGVDLPLLREVADDILFGHPRGLRAERAARAVRYEKATERRQRTAGWTQEQWQARYDDMVARRAAGQTYRAIGEAHGVSAERVRQSLAEIARKAAWAATQPPPERAAFEELPVRAKHILVGLGVDPADPGTKLSELSVRDLLHTANCGRKTVNDICAFAERHGFRLAPNPPGWPWYAPPPLTAPAAP